MEVDLLPVCHLRFLTLWIPLYFSNMLNVDGKLELFMSVDNSVSIMAIFFLSPATFFHVSFSDLHLFLQVGCPLGCTFCATGKGGFARNLKPHEIIEQVYFLLLPCPMHKLSPL